MLIYGNLTYLKNQKTSSDKIIELYFRFEMAVCFLWVLNFLGVEIVALQIIRI